MEASLEPINIQGRLRSRSYSLRKPSVTELHSVCRAAAVGIANNYIIWNNGQYINFYRFASCVCRKHRFLHIFMAAGQSILEQTERIDIMPLIELKNVTKLYGQGDGRVAALDGVSLTVERGEFVAVAGASGSGKSTLMNLLGCLDVQTAGEYLLDGVPVKESSEKKLSHIRNREIGFIFQNFNLISGLTAKENVELPLIYRGISGAVRSELAVHALRKVSLGNRMGHLPSQMSGGQQQRVAIARAIAAEPPIILADEPTGNLDSRCGREVMRILYDLNARGKTVIIITHDDAVAAQAARTIRISDGRVVSDVRN